MDKPKVVMRKENTHLGIRYEWGYIEEENPHYYYPRFILHREDGPAVIAPNDGPHMWYLHNNYYPDPNKLPLNVYLAYIKWGSIRLAKG